MQMQMLRSKWRLTIPSIQQHQHHQLPHRRPQLFVPLPLLIQRPVSSFHLNATRPSLPAASSADFNFRYLSTSSSSSSPISDLDGVPTLAASEAKKNLKNFDVILDVRESDEWEAGHIHGALHIPLGAVLRDMSTPKVQQIKNKRVLVYCKSGKRSALATKALNHSGFNATNLEGGYSKYSQ